ncbi:hypothetical protein ACM90X_09770 [Enterobacter hormaechei]|uniref:hypothetical protein n=1 Tax=Enterobacter hormaechei TaxID=158836 RepID=UPI003B9D37B8
MSVSRFLIENNGSNQNNIKLAISKTYHLCKDAGLQRITLLFPAKRTFSHSDIATFLGEQAAKALLKDQKVDLGNNILLDFNIPKNFSVHGKHDIVLATYLTDKDMDIVDSARNVNSIVFLPWSEVEGKRWLSTWAPEIVGPSTWKVQKAQLLPPVGDEILRLGRCINMSTGLSHPSDKDMAKRIFTSLKKQGFRATEEEIRQFAVNNGWEPVRAKELASFAKKYIG